VSIGKRVLVIVLIILSKSQSKVGHRTATLHGRFSNSPTPSDEQVVIYYRLAALARIIRRIMVQEDSICLFRDCLRVPIATMMAIFVTLGRTRNKCVILVA
jgi:hypothetical protein